MYGTSLNPNKFVFVVSEGNNFGHIVRKEGIYIDPKRIKTINDLNPPTSKKGVQSFFAKIKFIWICPPYYDTIVNPIKKLLKKDQKLEWTTEIQETFTKIKNADTTAPILVIPNFHKYFILCSFSS